MPRAGYRAGAAEFLPKGETKTAVFNTGYDSDDALARDLIIRAGRNHTWHSTATYKSLGDRRPGGSFKIDRSAENVLARQCFHGDVDIGAAKPYPTFDAGKAALLAACTALSLPLPITICSGTGLHFYYPLAEPVTDMQLWLHYAGVVALAGKGLKLDETCSTDRVRLLRTPGTFNHKAPPALPVYVDAWGAGPVPLGIFEPFLGLWTGPRRRCRDMPLPKELLTVPQYILEAPASDTSLVVFAIDRRAHFEPINGRCEQMRHFIETGCSGAGEEPVWKGCLGVLAFVTGGESIAHELSSLDPRYDAKQTQAKFDERLKLTGPTTCAEFQRHSTKHLCEGCSWRSPRLVSPAQLGEIDD